MAIQPLNPAILPQGPLSEDMPAETGGQDLTERNKKFREQIDACKAYRRLLVKDWQTNVDYRRGKPFPSQSDADRVVVNMDWSLTKEKQDTLFSQIPAVRVNHPPQTIDEDSLPWIHGFEQRINDIGIKSGVDSALDEILPDCINAAGFGVAIVSRESITEEVEVPAMDLSTLPPEMQTSVMQSGMLPDGSPIPVETVPREIDNRYIIDRVSPADFLWPLGFTGSDFNKSTWLGRSGKTHWAEAKSRFNLSDEDKMKVVGDDTDISDRIDRLVHDTQHTGRTSEDMVAFDEIFYREYSYDDEAKSFDAIRRLVFVHGIQDPVFDDPWEGQRIDEESGQLIGALKYPIRVLTLVYMTDEAIPPSDTAVGRPQVDEINKARTQMIQQREHSLPVRWFDVNRVDPTIQYTLMRGTWQGMIPVLGNGDNIIGEVARSGMPSENFHFDRIAKDDLARVWQISSGQGETKAEADSIRAGAASRVARERAKVGKFFVEIMEVLGGLISIFDDPASFGEGFTPQVSRTLSYSILADSTVLLDSNQRLSRLIQFMNFTAKSGFVDLEPVLKEIASLSGLDPALVIRPPKSKPPVEPNISLRLTGVEDLLNPLVLAFLMNSGQAPESKLIESAKQLIAVSVSPPQQADPQGPPEGSPPGMPPGLPPGLLPPGQRQLPPGEPEVPRPPVPGVGQDNPEWAAMPRINQRILEREQE